jgi:hypothetical protein
MSSMSEVIVEDPIVGEVTGVEDEKTEGRQFTRLERMLLFAVVTECERCIRAEGVDCLQHGQKRIDCPFYYVRELYVHDVEVWRERVG